MGTENSIIQRQLRINPLLCELGAGVVGYKGPQSPLQRTIGDGFIARGSIGKGETESLDVRGALAGELHVRDGLVEFPT